MENLNKEKKEWAVICMDGEDIRYEFFDTDEAAYAYADSKTYATDVVKCRLEERKSAIEFVRDEILTLGKTVDEALKDYEDDEHIWELGDDDMAYVRAQCSVFEESVKVSKDEDGDINPDKFGKILTAAATMMQVFIEKADDVDMSLIARGLESEGYGKNLMRDGELHIAAFSAALAHKMYDEVLSTVKMR